MAIYEIPGTDGDLISDTIMRIAGVLVSIFIKLLKPYRLIDVYTSYYA